MSYTSYIKRVLSCDFQITPANGNIDGGGRILKENCLLLQFTSIFSCTIDARITKTISEAPTLPQRVGHIPLWETFYKPSRSPDDMINISRSNLFLTNIWKIQ